MKVGIINATYAVGSTGFLAQEIYTKLKEADIDAYMFWAIKCKETKKDKSIIRIGNTIDHKVHALLYRIFNNQGFNSKLATIHLCHRIKELGINVLQLHNLHSNYIDIGILFSFCKKNRIATNIILHDCWFFTGLCPHFYPYNKCMQWKKGCVHCPINQCHSYQRQVYRNYLRKKKYLSCLGNLLFVTSGTKWIHELGKQSFLSCTTNHLIIKDWIDLSLFKQSCNKEEIMSKYGLDAKKRLCLAVSQIWNTNKGVETLLEIGKQFGETVEIIAVGNPNGYDKETCVKFIGYTSSRQELIDLYYSADVTINTSRMETFGLVTVESLACGTPVIAYDNTGTSELIPERCGWLVEDGNIGAFIEKLKSVLSQDLQKMREDCKVWVYENYNIEKQTQKYVELFRIMDKTITCMK